MMNKHRWSGWPGAWCLDCGCEDPHELWLSDESPDSDDQQGAFLAKYADHPGMKPCPCPNSKDHDPYHARERMMKNAK